MDLWISPQAGINLPARWAVIYKSNKAGEYEQRLTENLDNGEYVLQFDHAPLTVLYVLITLTKYIHHGW